jgi:folate-binding protein YgfZ
MKAAHLSDRGVVRVAGEDARKFLNGLVTSDLGKATAASGRFAALLTPQGKIIVDFIVTEPENGGGFVLDCPRDRVSALIERLGFYRLRAKVTIEDASDALAVLAAWDGGSGTEAAGPAGGTLDPRWPQLGRRAVVPPAQVALAAGAAESSDYEAHRIALGVPRGGIDFAYGDAFPHEANMDQLNGIDFDKGCFVGQEVVSRMEHRGLARTRVVPIALEGAPPPPGTAVTAAGRPVGTTGSAANGRALAMLRLDRVEEALAGGASLLADGVPLRLIKPAWARFQFPSEASAEK